MPRAERLRGFGVPSGHIQPARAMNNEPIYQEERNGYTIKIHQDYDGRDPYEDNDGMFPMMIEGGRNFSYRNYHDLKGQILKGLSGMSAAQVADLCDKLDGGDTIKADAITDAERYYREDGTPEDLADMVRDNITEAIEDLASGSDALEVLETIADALGWPCLNTSSNGYSQGDYVDILVAWTPEMEKRTGVTKEQAAKDDMQELKQNAKVWGAWAWGDVYGYTVEGPDGRDESCWGYLEPEIDPAENMYVVQEARSVADAMAEKHTATQ